MDDDTLRSIELTRTGDGRFEATNRHGDVLAIGGETDFSPIELLLASLAGCSALDVDSITGKRATPDAFDVRATAHKIRDEQGNHLVDLKLTFEVRFPDGEDGDRAREVLPRAVQQTRDRLCTVSRTIALGAPIEYVEK